MERGFTFYTFRRAFGEQRGTRFETQRGIDLEDLFERAQSPNVSSINYEIIMSKEQAFNGMEKELVRNGKRLKVKIPAGVRMGSSIRLKDALETTDGQPGDIIINIRIK